MRSCARSQLFSLVLSTVASPDAAADVPAGSQAVLDGIRLADKGQLAVSEEDGRFLRLLVTSKGTQRALEIGTASGYSAIWIGLGLRDTGGRLVTIEYDKARAAEAVQNIKKAGLSDVVHVVTGDALKEISKQTGPFDFAFVDAWKRDYQRYFDLVFPKLDRGALFLAHNVVNKRDEMGDFLTRDQSHPGAHTTTVTAGA